MKSNGQRAYAWGRVASLPFAVLLELCARLHRGDNTSDTLTWLNVFAHGTQNRRQRFGRRPISSVNLLKFRRRVLPIYEKHLAEIAATVPAGLPVGTVHRSPNRIGKIARLPHAIRAEVNRRLLDGQTGDEIAAWLNRLPAVTARMKVHFDSRPVTAGNVSNWRMGGFKDYLREAEARRHA